MARRQLIQAVKAWDQEMENKHHGFASMQQNAGPVAVSDDLSVADQDQLLAKGPGQDIWVGWMDTACSHDQNEQEAAHVKGQSMQEGGHACTAGLVAATDDLSAADQERLLAAATPKLPLVWRRDIAAQTGAEAQPPSSFGQIVRCSRFHGPRIIIIGDAAHCVTSTLGQVRSYIVSASFHFFILGLRVKGC